MIIILSLLAFIAGMWWVGVNVNPDAFAGVVTVGALLPVVVVAVWMTR